MAEKRYLITCMRNEGPFILEWVAYNRLIGFTDILIFTNDCTDGTDLICDQLHEMGLVHHIRNSDYENKGPQWAMIKHAWAMKEVKKADWVFISDVDEYLVIKTGDGTLDALFEALPEAELISPQWRFFGMNGVASFKDLPITQQFIHAATGNELYPLVTLMCKTLFRPEMIQKPGVHIPRFKTSHPPQNLKWYSGNGRPLVPPFSYEHPILQPPNNGFELLQLNHYALRSADSLLVKNARGLPNHRTKSVDLNYVVRRNFNNVEETSILKHQTLHNQHIERLKSDAKLRELHLKACQNHSAEARTLRETQEGITLYGSLLLLDGGRQIDPKTAYYILKQQYQSNLKANTKGKAHF